MVDALTEKRRKELADEKARREALEAARDAKEREETARKNAEADEALNRVLARHGTSLAEVLANRRDRPVIPTQPTGPTGISPEPPSAARAKKRVVLNHFYRFDAALKEEQERRRVEGIRQFPRRHRRNKLP